MIKGGAGVSGIHTILLLFVCLPAKHQPTRQTPALQRKHTTGRQANHPSTHLTPAHPTDANLPAKHQPTRQTPALQRKHTTGRQANQSGEGPGRESSRATSGSPRGGEGEGQDGPRPGPFQEAPRDRHGPA